MNITMSTITIEQMWKCDEAAVQKSINMFQIIGGTNTCDRVSYLPNAFHETLIGIEHFKYEVYNELHRMRHVVAGIMITTRADFLS